VLAAFDSAFWLVSAPDAWLGEIAGTFTDVREDDPGAPLTAL
jgi:hypothetical protein